MLPSAGSNGFGRTPHKTHHLANKQLDAELRLFGVPLGALLSGALSAGGRPKELLLSEYGLGGGANGDHVTPAANPAQVAASPYCES